MTIIKDNIKYILLICGLVIICLFNINGAKADVPAGYSLISETYSKRMHIYEYRHKDTGYVLTVVKNNDGGVSTLQLVQGRGGYHLDAKEYKYYKNIMEGK